jgi:hypothetical protein
MGNDGFLSELTIQKPSVGHVPRLLQVIARFDKPLLRQPHLSQQLSKAFVGTQGSPNKNVFKRT